MYLEDLLYSPLLPIVGVLLAIVLVLVLLLFIRRQSLRRNRPDLIVLAIEVPKGNDKTPLAAEQMFNNLYGLFRTNLQQLLYGHKSVSFEIKAERKSIRFFCTVEADIRDYVAKQIYAQYPDARVYEVPDYVNLYEVDVLEREIALANIITLKHSFYPIKTFSSFEVDPMAALTSSLSELEDNEDFWLQIALLPICLLYTSPSPRDRTRSRMPSSA